MADNIRSIPSVVDGLEPGQRKIMWISLDRLRKETRVESLAGIVQAQYHQGDDSLIQAIVGLAQDFVGSNNIYWLLPIGAFGSRDEGGKDASSARYIYTNMTPISKTVFSKEDTPLLTYMEEAEGTVEPEYFVPILPALLVNGAEGIGTGWSTNIPSLNPVDIVGSLKRMMNGEAVKPMDPWYRGWTGLIEKIPGNEHQWRVTGRIEEIDETTLAITELPIKVWTSAMKTFLYTSIKGSHRSATDLNDKEKKKRAKAEFIDDIREEHSTDYIRFIVKLSPEEMAKAKEVGLYKKFNLITTISTSNMVAFDPQGRLRRYSTPEEILKEFYHVRLDFYKKRRDYQLEQLKFELERISQQARFIKLIIDREFTINNKKRKVLETELRDLEFPMFYKNSGKPVWPEESGGVGENENNDDEDSDGDESTKKSYVAPSYDYLLQIAPLTAEHYAQFLREKEDVESRFNELLNADIKTIWIRELDDFLVKWDQFLEEDTIRRSPTVTKRIDGGTKRKLRGRKDDSADLKNSTGKRKAVRSVNHSQAEYISPPPIEEAVLAPSEGGNF